MRPGTQVLLDGVQKRLHRRDGARQRDGRLVTGIAPRRHGLPGRNVARADLKAHRRPASLPVEVLRPRAQARAVVDGDTDPRARQVAVQVGGGLLDGARACVVATGNGHDRHLNRCDGRREDGPLVVAVHHQHTADGAGAHAPRRREDRMGLAILALVRHVEGAPEGVAEVV